MSSIILEEYRPFSFLDFCPQFESEGKQYPNAYGTVRNKFLVFKRQGKIEVDYKSKQTFYTLKGVRFGRCCKRMTSDHMEVSPVSSLSSSNPIYDLVKDLPNDGHALHDIRLKFEIEDIWYIVSTNHPEFEPNKKSKDITLNSLQISDLTITTTVHHTNTVSVIVACSERPVAVDHKGLIRLSNALTRIEERLSRLLEGHVSLSSSIPDHNTWTVTMWSSGEYAGKEFEMTWEDERPFVLYFHRKAGLLV
jgi:hypothetical protein